MIKNKHARLLVIGLFLILAGSLLGYFVHTAGGSVKIQDLRFNAADGSVISALLYTPEGVSADNPAPGVLAIHGYINSRETQSAFSIELARRGFVVLAMDQSGHGYSDPPAFANVFGAVAGLKYLRSLEFVDKERIGMEGHSMGGWASRAAAGVMPDAYHALVMEGASTARVTGLGEFSASPQEPKNTAIVFSRFDEFSQMMWQGAKPDELPTAPPLQQLFGTDEAVERGKLYGSVEEGTARRLYQPATTHPGDHISPTAVLNAVEWLQLTLDQPSEIEPDSHIFLWKEIGTLLALIGLAVLAFPLMSLLAQFPVFSSALHPLPPNHGDRGIHWWITAGITALVPILTYFPLMQLGQALPPNAFWPQQITNGIVTWALGNGLITLVLLSLVHMLVLRKRSVPFDHYGLTVKGQSLAATVGLALTTFGILYGIAALVDWWWTLDFRFWVVALKLLSSEQFIAFLCYLPAFTLFFGVLSTAFNSRLRRPDAEGTGKAMGKMAVVTVLGFVIMLIIDYTTLFTTGALLFGQPLLTIVAIQFVPLLAFVACVAVFCFRLTGRVYLGAFINGLMVTWYIVAGQATHFG